MYGHPNIGVPPRKIGLYWTTKEKRTISQYFSMGRKNTKHVYLLTYFHWWSNRQPLLSAFGGVVDTWEKLERSWLRPLGRNLRGIGERTQDLSEGCESNPVWERMAKDSTVWQSGNLQNWKSGNPEIWKSRCLGIWNPNKSRK